MRLVKLLPAEWKLLSEKAHLVVFNEKKSPELERIDFTLMCVDEEDSSPPQAYVTCKELDAESIYIQYGGAFPGVKDTIFSFRCFQAFMRFFQENYKRVGFYVENTNTPMLKLAMKTGFKITGVRNYKNFVLLEHILEF